MSYLQKQMEVLKFDKRLLEMNMKKKIISTGDYEQHLSSLTDSEDNAEKLELANEAEQASQQQTMNGDHHPAAPTSTDEQAQTAIPINNDPFGSGF